MRPKVRVVLYTKGACSLCEEMKEEINRAGCFDLYTLEEVDIEADAELFARYQYEIPVLTVDGVEAFKHQLQAEEFKAYVAALVNE